MISALGSRVCATASDGQVAGTYRGNPLRSANTRTWRAALAKCGITDFRWQDLRHIWASWLRQSDVVTWVLQEWGGWKSESMVRRYAVVDDEEILDVPPIVGNRVRDHPEGIQDAAARTRHAEPKHFLVDHALDGLDVAPVESGDIARVEFCQVGIGHGRVLGCPFGASPKRRCD
ncbi:hypothetical protein E5A73_18875 [Sphingomonas gei]|uniref:Tyr recombinase domain-containing protein n=1 Tax=Sphingomonas gei TaxID=1395960 RepID=A0A4S1X2Y3_9SPHN|nr:hypothetical protein E5A73_18875 [Sphingomonas gei]